MHVISKAFIACAMLATSGAYAAPITFNLIDPDSRNGILNSTYAKQYNYEENEVSLSLTGWSYGVTNTTTTTCTKYRFGVCKQWKTQTTTSLKEAIEQDYVGKWDGLGVEKSDTPNHAVDNEGNDFDMHLLSFGEIVKLTSLDLGWLQNDSDISILAFTGPLFDQSSLVGKKWQDLLGMGWSLVGNYYNVDHGGNSGAVNLDGIYSQLWLVGSYNPVFGNTFSGPNKNKSSGNDFYKLKAITVEQAPRKEVPEPAITLLMAAGLLGMTLNRRR